MNKYQETIEQCKALGTDREFQAFVKTFASPLGGALVVYAHVRRAWNSGTGMKPEFCGIPLTFGQHHIQHLKGERDLLAENNIKRTIEQSKAWFDNWAEFYRKEFILMKIKENEE